MQVCELVECEDGEPIDFSPEEKQRVADYVLPLMKRLRKEDAKIAMAVVMSMITTLLVNMLDPVESWNDIRERIDEVMPSLVRDTCAGDA